MAIWSDSDNSYTEDHVASRIRDPLRSLAQITWGSPKPATSYGRFSGLIDKVGSPSPGAPRAGAGAMAPAHSPAAGHRPVQ